jgi:myo-inositol-1(or 4)-monophosphatase
MDLSLDVAMQVAIEAAATAGEILRNMLDIAEVREKAPKDLVTDADVASQKAIETRLLTAFPEHLFLGEESGDNPLAVYPSDQDRGQWVVDPLDGTANYVHRLPNFAVSIALMRGNTSYVGVVYDPMSDELYAAKKGGGATVNGKPLRCSSCVDLNYAMVAASFPPQISRESIELKQFIEILLRSQSVRRLGSAALNLCYVAQGRLDAYWAGCLKPWDIAGGGLIAQEAGAIITTQNGRPFDPWLGELVATSTPSLNQQVRDCLAMFDSP